MSAANATNLYCPGCQVGDFAQPHICGLGTAVVPTMMFRPSPTATIFPSTPTPACDHCFCLKQKAGWYDVPSLRPVYPGTRPATDSRHLRPHQVCCNCGNRRVKGADSGG